MQYGDKIQINIMRQEYSNQEKDKIFDQDIPVDDPVGKGDTVNVKVSLGARKVLLPDVTDWEFETAKSTIVGLGLLIDKRSSYDQTVEKGKGISTDPKGPMEVEPGTYVRVTVSLGKNKETVPVPNFINMKWDLAKTTAESMKLTLATEIYPGQTFPATVEVVYPTIDPSSHTFQCKIVIPNSRNLLRPGMYVTTTIGLGKAKAIVVPYQSVEKLVGANDRYVFIVEEGRAKRVAVTLGQRFDQDIEIIAPEIHEGVEFVTTGQHKLVDGVKVNVVE